jgi:type 1 fimbriae regulatory protein FimB/type 1 fimbriae regulatory protein FimE
MSQKKEFSVKVLKPPIKQPNKKRRSREYLTESEINSLIAAAIHTKHINRNKLIIYMMFYHGLRVSELINLKWEQVCLKNKIIHINRAKNGVPSIHPLKKRELYYLKQLLPNHIKKGFIFNSERGEPFSARQIHYIIHRMALHSDINILVHPHMLRHSCGYFLANKGVDTRSIQAYLGHADIKSTVIYTEISPARFANFF